MIGTKIGVIISSKNQVYLFDGTNLSFLSSTFFEHEYHSTVEMDQYIYVLSGIHTTAVERLNTASLEWENWGHMNKKRSNFVAIAAQRSIYAIGGFTGGKQRPSNSIDRFSQDSKTWYRLNVTIPIKLHSFGFCRGSKDSIIIIGGKSDVGPNQK